MDPEKLKAAGFSDAEIGEYKSLTDAGFSEKEINDHYAGKVTPAPAVQPEPKTAGDRVVGTAKNLPGSLVQVGKDLLMAAVHPIDTVGGLYNLLMGGADKAARAVIPESMLGPETPFEKQRSDVFLKAVEPITKSIENPAGILERAVNYTEEKPAQALMNLSLGLSGAARGAEAANLGRTATMLTRGAQFTDPLSVAAKAASAAAAPIRNSGTAAKLYESALKIPPASVSYDVRNKAVKTGLEGEYAVSKKGLETLRNDIGGINAEITRVINEGTAAGRAIDMQQVVARLDQLKDFYKDYPRAKKYLDDIDAIKQEVLTQTPGAVPLDVAQKMKQRVYAINRKHYGDMKGVDVEADKAIARGLKEEIVSQYPELAGLNAKDSALINLEEVLERAVNRTRNYDVIRLGDTIMTTTGATIGGAPGAAAGFLAKHILENPTVKSRIAFALKKAGKGRMITAVKDRPSLTTVPNAASQLTQQEF